MRDIKRSRFLYAIALCLLIGLMGFSLAGCSSDDDDGDDIDVDENGYVAYVVFDSDSDNGVIWECTLGDDIFRVDDTLLQDEAYEGEGSGEEQDFFLYPLEEGQTTATFTCKDGEGVEYEYVYTLTVDGDLFITVDSAEGTANGQPAEAPEMIVDAVG